MIDKRLLRHFCVGKIFKLSKIGIFFNSYKLIFKVVVISLKNNMKYLIKNYSLTLKGFAFIDSERAFYSMTLKGLAIMDCQIASIPLTLKGFAVIDSERAFYSMTLKGLAITGCQNASIPLTLEGFTNCH